jgi:hypothetical protein
MVKDKDNSKNNSKDRETNEMLELLKSFYVPDEQQGQVQDFDEFYSKIEDKLEKSDPSRKITELTNQLENQYLARQQRLESFVRRMDDQSYLKPKKTSKNNKRLLLAFILFILVSLVVIYLISNFELHKRTQVPTTSPIISTAVSLDQN